MSTGKRVLLPFHCIAAGDMSTAAITGTVSELKYLDDVGIQLNWTGSPVGTFQIQISADYLQDTNNPPNVLRVGHWVPITLTYWDGVSAFVTTTDIPTSLGSPIYLDMALLSAPYIRIVYTKISGTGTLDAYITAKGI